MCLVKTPKVDPNASKPKDPTVIRNPYLDGVGPQAKAMRAGRASLRITRGSGVTPSAPPTATPTPSPPPLAIPSAPAVPGGSPVRGGGGRISREANVNVR
jgi:hypothetical protein